MRNRMRPGLFEEWLTFEELEPFGFPLRNLQMAYTLATQGNFAGGRPSTSPKGKPTAFRTEEFLLRPGGAGQRSKPRRMSADETTAHVSAVFAGLGARRVPGQTSG